MGSPPTEIDRYDDEGPQRTVTFARPFALGRYTVKFAEWDACAAAGGCGGYKPADQGWGRGRQPVVNVSWNDAQAYAAWLAARTGAPYRLPTEAEWEYAARAGTTTPFWTGATISTEEANYDGNYTYGAGEKGSYRKRTVAVDDPTALAANPFGLHHVHGNVWECVQDCYRSSYVGAPLDGSVAVEAPDRTGTRHARRLMGPLSELPPLRDPKQMRAGRPEAQRRVPGSESAYPIGLCLLIYWRSEDVAPGAVFGATSA